jgi:hypothetical protein
MKLPLILLTLALAGCLQRPLAGSYEAEQAACVTDAGSREEADACRCRVKQRFGNPCTDAGADQ